MIDFLITLLGIIVLSLMAYGCWISSVILSNRSKLRKITGAYYDYEIEEALKEMNMTQEQALDIYVDKKHK